MFNEIKTKIGTMYFEISNDEILFYDSDKHYITYNYMESWLNDKLDVAFLVF